MWKRTVAVALSSVVLLAGCAIGPGSFRERQDASLALYEKHAGAPVDRVRSMHRMDRWRSLGPDRLVIWTSVNKAWLFTLRAPCTGLEFTQSIRVSSSIGIVDRRFDKIIVERDECFIEEIRPVDYRALLRDQQQSRADKQS